MLEIVAWLAIGFISGSVPWALIVGKVLLNRDIRAVWDGNPGTANSWKLGGWAPRTTLPYLRCRKGGRSRLPRLPIYKHPIRFGPI
jgi:glycerol-3-phosphate acyltransferase PlsY